MTEKVKLSSDVANALQEVVSNPFHDKAEDIVRIHVRNPRSWEDSARFLNDLPLEDLIRALYIGYEVEQTPKEKIVQMFRTSVDEGNAFRNNPHAEWWEGRRMAIIDTLNALEVKIEGVNK